MINSDFKNPDPIGYGDLVSWKPFNLVEHGTLLKDILNERSKIQFSPITKKLELDFLGL